MNDLYCPQCDAPRTPDQLDEFGHCRVCGTQLLDIENAETPGEPEATTPEDTPFPEVISAGIPEAETSIPEPPRISPETVPEEPPLEEHREAPVQQAPVRQAPVQQEPVRQELVQEEPGSKPEPAEETPYAELVGDVERHLENGYELFGLVGLPSSGKTHCLKALTYLLRRHGVGSPEAGIEFRKASVPGQTAARVFDYAYTGPGDEKWVFVDAGGELYLRLRENDWSSYPEDSTRLTRWLHRCHGLFCFLHLQPGHFRGRDLDVDPTHEGDPTAREALETRRRKARQDQEELELFRHFFLFLRALKAEDGRVERVIERCRQSDNLDEALRHYQSRAPRLDIPVMFFFTQSDAYDREDFEIAPGVQVHPRTSPILPAVFAARYLPSLFSALVSQVQRFKFDFLQSYEDHPTGRRNEDGEEIVETYWTDPQDEQVLLSAGLMAGLEFVLRHRQTKRSRWHLPELSTRQALRLHKVLHPGDWKGVPPNLLSPARFERASRNAGRKRGEP